MAASAGRGAGGGPSWLWFLVPAAILVLTAAAIVALAPGAGILDPVLRVKSLTLPGEREIRLEKAGSYFLYTDAPGSSGERPDRRPDDRRTPAMAFSVTRADSGDPIPLEDVGMRATLDTDRHYAAVKRFEMASPGTVRVKGEYPAGVEGPERRAAVGPALDVGFVFQGVGRILAAVLVGLLGVGAAVVVLVLLILRRGRARRLLPTPPSA